MRPHPKTPNWLGDDKVPVKAAVPPAPVEAPAPAANTVQQPVESAAVAPVKVVSLSSAPDRITLNDVEVYYHVGVPDEERSKPQRLMISVELATDFTNAATTDFLATTIDYHAVYERLLHFGEGRTWRLIEKLAVDIANALLAEFATPEVTVEVKKFILKKSRYTSVRATRRRGA
ncbi:MAG: dihydroneopterin aldolase [Verrucomicrobia bacterium]|nr:dihydroneopterin aldolase [Verrucomicrobiota bacterium]